MKKIIRKLELAKVGLWGKNSDPITEQDLKDAVETFTPKRPVGIGHEDSRKDNAPKFGNVLSLQLSQGGKSLTGEVEFTEELDRLYTSGKYDGWSVSLPKRAKDGKAYLHHLAFLGATPPKIPGLKDLGAASYDYADGDEVIVHDFLGAIRETKNPEGKMNDEELKKLQAELAQAKEENAKLKAENEKLLAEKKELLEKAEKKEGDEDVKVPQEFADKMKQLEAEMSKNRLAAFRAKVESKVPAGLMGDVEALGQALSGIDTTVEFADSASGKKTSGTTLDLLASVLSKMPEPVVEGFSGFEFSDKTQTEKRENYAVKMMGAM